MKSKHSITFKILSVILCLAVVLPVTLSVIGRSGKAEALTSLPYIEKLKTDRSSFNILEIVPSKGEGSIGYYIDGQEPCAEWIEAAAQDTSAYYNAVSSDSVQQQRVDYLNQKFQALKTAGILGAGDTTPLELTAENADEPYSEVYPWEGHDGWSQMNLGSNETAYNVIGFFTYAQNGAFDQNKGEFTYLADGSGEYVQKIDYFSYGETNPEGGESYYYHPEFSEITDASAVAAGTAVYKNTATYDEPDVEPIYEDYVYVGTAGDSDFPGMEIGKKYYSVSSYGAPADTQSDYNAYVAASTSYELAASGEIGYFNPKSNVISYTYVGSGGTYNFTPSVNGNTYNIVYGTVYYEDGYTNNNWFLKNVLDWTEGEETKPDIDFTVNSVTADEATVDEVNNADMVVLSYGFVPGGTATQYVTTDISSDVKTAIQDKVEKSDDSDTDCNLPVIVDNRLLDGETTYLKALASALKGDDTFDSFVNGSVFFFDPGSPDDTRAALATDNFCEMYPESSYKSSGSPFYQVYEEIENENFLRTTEDSDAETLDEHVNMARAIRYILNYAGKRIITPKLTVNVLEIQPGSGSQITESTVKGWLASSGTDTSGINVNITTMSTAELIGKIDVISEKYDIVYIGSDLTGINPTNLDTTSYNDAGMNGLIYSNIGDTVTINSGDTSSYGSYSMSGLLDRDYSTQTFTSNNETYHKLDVSSQSQARTFRYSGNDLTETKMQELEDYADSGYPIIVSDDLVTAGHDATEAVTFSANVSGEADDDNGTVLLTAAPVVENGGTIPTFLQPSYQWYNDNGEISGETSNRYTAVSSGTYYCTISYTADGETYTATSNKVAASITSTGIKISVTTANSVTGVVLFGFNTLNKEYDYNVALSSDGSTLTAKPQKSGGYGNVYYNDDYTYQWYKDGSAISGATRQSYSPSEAGTYYCETEVTWLYYNNTWYTSYQQQGPPGHQQYGSLSNQTDGRSPDAVVTTLGDVSINSSSDGDEATIPSLSALAGSVDSGKVDDSSYLYELLTACESKPNFMAQSELDAAENRDRLIKYVNLSKPDIVWASDYPSDIVSGAYPTEYSIDNDGKITSLKDKDGTYYLEYYFKIRNDTDTDPVNTLYTCNLYIDANGDGRYNSSELLNDIVVRTWDGETQTAGGVVNSSALKADTEYYVSRAMPADKYGIVPWKLEIKKTAESGVIAHTSVHNYTHIPTPSDKRISLDILQINSNNGLSLEAQMQVVSSSDYYSGVTYKYYAGIYGKLFADISGDYDVNIETVTTSYINDGSTDTSGRKYWTHDGTTYYDLSEYLDSYNMVITGFKDMYGDLDQDSAEALASYIDTGKAILFTHDNTSFSAIPFDYYQTTDSYTNYYGTYNTVSPIWGYYFNVTIRDAVGLDRYGVTDEKYGHTSMCDPTLSSGIVASNGYLSLDGDTRQSLLDAGYSIAYEPKSARGSTVGETQGMTRGILDRYKGTSTAANPQKTSTVSQENEGQITTYPYDVNTAGFSADDDSTNYMYIAQTHSQYFQLNMNSPDTVVWYCLDYRTTDSSGNYLNKDSVSLFNDVSNAYYIYSKGNVTYSGAGHTTDTADVNSNVDEAKLFVNTMIAAYRVANTAPTVKFTDSSGKIVQTNFLIPADETGILSPEESTDDSRNVYFTVNDTNIGDKTISASFTYGTSETPLEDANDKSVQIYKAESDSKLGADESLVSGLVYYIKIDDVLANLNQNGTTLSDSGITIKITVKTTIGGTTLSGDGSTTSITLRKLTLFDLS